LADGGNATYMQLIGVLGAYIRPDQNIFMKFGGHVDNGLPNCAEWSKYDYFENPISRTVAMYHTYNIPAVNFNVVN